MTNGNRKKALADINKIELVALLDALNYIKLKLQMKKDSTQVDY